MPKKKNPKPNGVTPEAPKATLQHRESLNSSLKSCKERLLVLEANETPSDHDKVMIAYYTDAIKNVEAAIADLK